METFQLGDPDCEMAVVYNHDDFDRTGEDFAVVQIRIGIDEWFDEISVDPRQCGDLELLDRALASLTRVRDALTGLYDGRKRHAGRWPWTRTVGAAPTATTPEGEHVFPTAEQADARARSTVAFFQHTRPVPA